MKKVAVFASGNGSNFEELVLRSKDSRNYKISLLIVDKSNAKVIQRAKKLNIKTEVIILKDFINRKKWEEHILKILKQNSIDFIVLAGFMKILSSTFIDSYKEKIINIHPSLLPKHPGMNGIKDSYESDEEMGITIFYIDSGIDTGKIIFQDKFKKSNLTFEQAEKKIHQLEYKSYTNVLKKIL